MSHSTQGSPSKEAHQGNQDEKEENRYQYPSTDCFESHDQFAAEISPESSGPVKSSSTGTSSAPPLHKEDEENAAAVQGAETLPENSYPIESFSKENRLRRTATSPKNVALPRTRREPEKRCSCCSIL